MQAGKLIHSKALLCDFENSACGKVAAPDFLHYLGDRVYFRRVLASNLGLHIQPADTPVVLYRPWHIALLRMRYTHAEER